MSASQTNPTNVRLRPETLYRLKIFKAIESFRSLDDAILYLVDFYEERKERFLKRSKTLPKLLQ